MGARRGEGFRVFLQAETHFFRYLRVGGGPIHAPLQRRARDTGFLCFSALIAGKAIQRAKVIHDGASNFILGVGFELQLTGGIKTVDGRDQSESTRGNEIFQIYAALDLFVQAVRKVADLGQMFQDEAITILRAAVARETEAPIGYTQLAMAYGRKGDYAQADLASAQAAFLRGDNKTARDLASRAKTRFAIGTPGWVKADDIVSAKPLPGEKSN